MIEILEESNLNETELLERMGNPLDITPELAWMAYRVMHDYMIRHTCQDCTFKRVCDVEFKKCPMMWTSKRGD